MQEAAARKGYFRELRCRKVFRTAGLHVVGAWLVMQLVDVLFPGWGLPDVTISILFVAALRVHLERIDDAEDFAAKLDQGRAARRPSVE